MLKKYLSKFTIDILPSIMATVVGAYIVNVYIIPKTREDRPPAPAAASVPAPDKAVAKPAEAAAAAVDAPEPAPTTTKKATEKPVEKAATDKSDKADANKAVEARRHAPAREKAAAKPESAKSESAKAEPAKSEAPAPVLATVGTAPSGDANDLARAAIERLSRGEKVETPRAPEPRMPERTAAAQPPVAPAVQPAQQAQPMQQLPPPIVVSNPSVEDAVPALQSRGPRPPGEVPVPMREMQADAGNVAVVPMSSRTCSAVRSRCSTK
ncbi:hypothetical protein RPMA_24135 [Tardiphaga alba]|uniref:Uncharacterized protein n=1 Tax=Tardiphaga alba TaxID=340268 RepID=A0ABX8AD40_9BRAD|nr:hypothetical protein [Tardiphaga alba]QUS41593.1 hypothetical protein RPMA_24135 [Tardiphaga alba]